VRQNGKISQFRVAVFKIGFAGSAGNEFLLIEKAKIENLVKG
jgi:hypothetical protein